MTQRKLPLWMLPVGREQNEAMLLAGKKNSRSMNEQYHEDGKLNEDSTTTGKNDEQNEKRTIARHPLTVGRSNNTTVLSDKSIALQRPPIEYLPFVDYTGSIEHYIILPDVAHSSQMLLKWIDRTVAGTKVPIAFDLEWSFSFKTGPGRTGLMQLCAEPGRCILYQLSCLKHLPIALLQLLGHERVILLGVNIKNDLRKLARDFPEVSSVDSIIERCIDLGQFYNKLHQRSGVWSMDRLVQQVLKQRVNKDKRIRMSKWDVLPLTEEQKRYAAIDVYITLLLYQELCREQRIQDERENISV
ncbi:Werner Syndrome-like exonuclease [Anopheles aquasalis]|uniref:Werner Syndrome-like exonuclease n=1 Tax=Anopheles aquasalis TaxID=42839 RepID=UPI00215A73D8|nr:Werner Syndrome-like exonuclease [Anopheles aquasalis]XP_050099167.1 Werner Syndrome-like exonuclease [Anopheles aquasalis]XP_050099168.1 Werner Syndrome-like exonuclease [Anopheles aquasalis]